MCLRTNSKPLPETRCSPRLGLIVFCFVNPTPVPRCEYVDIPVAWRKPGPRLRCERFIPATPAEVEKCGPIDLPAFGTKSIPLVALEPAASDPRLRHEDRRAPTTFLSFNNFRLEIPRKGDALIESPTHALTYDPATGRILGLFDKKLNWDVPAGPMANIVSSTSSENFLTRSSMVVHKRITNATSTKKSLINRAGNRGAQFANEPRAF